MTSTLRRVAELWPRRAPGLPPGQRRLLVFPRFSDQPLRRPPASDGPVQLRIGGIPEPFTIALDELRALEWREQRSDLHCVTT